MPDHPDLLEELLAVWRTHNAIELELVAGLPEPGFTAVPPGPEGAKGRGRTVAEQLAHCHAIRLSWLRYHETGKRARKGDLEEVALTRAGLKRALAASGKAVEQYLAKALRGEAPIRHHGRSAVRWLAYLISHESHHRGQIALALKQAGWRLPEAIAMGALWGGWIFANLPKKR
jgi:uncharacterized damage-inducible protein DinB